MAGVIFLLITKINFLNKKTSLSLATCLQVIFFGKRSGYQ